LAQRPQPERLAADEWVERDRHHQGLLFGLLDHLLKLVDNHVAEFAAGVVAVDVESDVV